MSTAVSDETWKSDPWRGVNPLDPEVRKDPHPFLRRLREFEPVNETPVGFFRLTRYADVLRVLREVKTGVRLADGSVFGGGAITLTGGPGQFVLQQDPPDHTRLRRLMSHAFRPKAIEGWRVRAEALVTELLDRVASRGEMDVIADLALPVPATLICELMGVPVADRDRFTDWTAAATHLLAAAISPPEVTQRGIEAAMSLANYFSGLIEERRHTLRDDLLSDLIRAEEEGDRLSPEELLSQAIGLLIAGFETTIGLIGNGILALIRNPEELAKLRANPELIGAAVEECLRYDGPILLTVRITREATTFGDILIPADRPVMCMVGAANRDPEVFPDPDRFDIRRTSTSENLAFGGGIHYCLGAHLARMEAQLAIGQFVRRFTDFEIDESSVEWGKSLFRVLGKFPLRFRSV